MPDIFSEKLQQKLSSRPPVPRIPIPQDPLSKKCARFDNKDLVKRKLDGLVYIVSNETGLDETVKQLIECPKIPNGCHIGFSGWHNFDIMAARLSDRGIICDINPENALFLSNTLKILCTSTNRFDFIKKAEAYVEQYSWNYLEPHKEPESTLLFSPYVGNDARYYQLLYENEQVSLQSTISTSWLYTNERFNHIRQLAQTGKIALITEDICATDSFSKMRNLLEENSCQIDSLYVSNISNCIFENRKVNFINTVKGLAKDAILIHAPMDLNQQVLIPNPHAQPNWNELLFAPKLGHDKTTTSLTASRASSPNSPSIQLPQAPEIKSSYGFFTKAVTATVAVSAIAVMCLLGSHP